MNSASERVDSATGTSMGAATALAIAAVVAATACEPAARGGGAGDGRSDDAAADSGHTASARGALGEGGTGDGQPAGGTGGDSGSNSTGSGMPGTCAPGSVAACYTGPAGTAGVGRCAPGTQTCRSDGLGYGPCTGEVTPAAELCATPVDESCDGVASCPQRPPWARGYGGSGWDNGLSIVSDASGNYYVSGDFEGTVDFGAGPLTSAGQSDVFFLKLDPSGSVIWSRRYGTEFDDQSGTMTVDGNGNIFLAGMYGGLMGLLPGPDFGGGPISGADDTGAFVAKFDANGDHVWSAGYPVLVPSMMWRVAEVAVDASDNVYMIYNLDDYAYLTRLGAGGTGVLWTQDVPASAVSFGAVSLAVDSAGNVIVANEDPPIFYYPGPFYFTVSKFDPSGALLWQRLFESDGTAAASSVAVNAADEILVAGFTDGIVDFGGGVLPAGPVLVKLDAAGQHVFSRSVRFGDKIALDSAGGMVVAGGGLARLDASGNELWWVSFDASVEDVVFSPNGTIAITGSMMDPVDFGTGPIPYAAHRDVFVATFNP
ncbi:outer membrane protein assembly factor BamB family protein [Sorangium sp. So ce124]|uniref:outer membrane protein assembly factor BamB family protein n=1 Tax=Sorangium sp. So ce124 TaxID=3133280 RepID=UPI003F6081B5